MWCQKAYDFETKTVNDFSVTPDECCPDAGNRLFPIFIEISYTNHPISDLGIRVQEFKSEIRIPKSEIDMGATGFDRGLYRSLDARRAFCR
jgi:hypothetical protein